MWRGILAYVLCVRSLRQLGCWSVLIGLADVCEAAWRKRMRQARAWLAWLVSEMLAVSACTPPWLVRIHTGFDLLAGRLAEVQVTSDKVAEQWTLFNVQEGDLLISDRIHG